MKFDRVIFPRLSLKSLRTMKIMKFESSLRSQSGINAKKPGAPIEARLNKTGLIKTELTLVFTALRNKHSHANVTAPTISPNRPANERWRLEDDLYKHNDLLTRDRRLLAYPIPREISHMLESEYLQTSSNFKPDHISACHSEIGRAQYTTFSQ